MSWHHGDYIDLISAIVGAASAVFAACATWLAKKSTELSKESIDETKRQAGVSQLRDELVSLSERCNATVGLDSLVKREHASLVEMATALTVAREALNESDHSDYDKVNLTNLFIRHLRPGIRFEIDKFEALMDVPSAFSNDTLRQQYRDAQIFLCIESPRHLPDPIINNP